VALAEHFGKHFLADDKKEDTLARFVAEMNRRAASINLKETKYFDPHGLGKNHASARDLATLAFNSLKNPMFARYVQTRRHTCEFTDGEGKKQPATWE